jgi:hypothetical protein
MRTETTGLGAALIVGAILLALLAVASIGTTVVFYGRYAIASFHLFGCAAIGCLILGVAIMTQDTTVGIREFVKQVAVWLGIVVLLPFAVWYGTSAFSPPPDWKRYTREEERLTERLQEANADEKAKIREEKDRLENERDEQERRFYGHMFWVACPLGLGTFIIGIVFPVQAVGGGLMFGGLISLAVGCYSYWDRMGDNLRFASLVIALLVVSALGTWRFRTPGRDRVSTTGSVGAADRPRE